MAPRSLLRVAAAALLLGTALPAGAETVVNVASRTVHVSDLDPGAPADIAAIDLGRAPPPGSSRLYTRREILDLLREAGADPKRLSMPPSVRVVATAERWNSAELAARAESTVRANLPPGVTLVKLGALQGVVVPPGTLVASARPVIPKRVGRHELTLMAELRADDETVARSPLKLVVEVSEEALAPALRKGDRITLVVDQGNARIGAGAMTMADANIGDTVYCKVTSTGKVLKARVTSRDIGTVVAQ
jgi:hypothetical protein